MKIQFALLIISIALASCNSEQETPAPITPPASINNGWVYSTKNQFPVQDHGYKSEIQSIFFINPNLLFATGYTSILRSTDQGETWEEVLDFNRYVITTHTDDSIYIIENTLVQRTSVNDIHLQTAGYIPEELSIVKEFKVQGKSMSITGLAVSGDFIMLTSENYGQNWTRTMIDPFDECDNFCMNQGFTVYPYSNLNIWVYNNQRFSTNKSTYNYMTITETYNNTNQSAITFREYNCRIRTFCNQDNLVFVAGTLNNKYVIMKKEF